MTMLGDGVKAKGAEDAVQVRDIAELVLEAAGETKNAAQPRR
jgi:hypothetical protein